MKNLIMKKMVVLILAISVLNLGLPVSAYAGLIGTEQLIAAQERDNVIVRIDRALQQEHVTQAMRSLGVNADDISDRLAGLTSEELRQIDQELENLPAGGGAVLIAIGAVFVVLLILELVGVTDVFSKL